MNVENFTCVPCTTVHDYTFPPHSRIIVCFRRQGSDYTYICTLETTKNGDGWSMPSASTSTSVHTYICTCGLYCTYRSRHVSKYLFIYSTTEYCKWRSCVEIGFTVLYSNGSAHAKSKKTVLEAAVKKDKTKYSTYGNGLCDSNSCFLRINNRMQMRTSCCQAKVPRVQQCKYCTYSTIL